MKLSTETKFHISGAFGLLGLVLCTVNYPMAALVVGVPGFGGLACYGSKLGAEIEGRQALRNEGLR